LTADLPRRLATIDLGTNTVRVLVVEANGQDWWPLYQAQRVTRLGEGQAAAGRLLDDPMRRTVDTVAEFIAAAERLGAPEVHVVATSAVREAPNRDDFVARVRAATGHGVRVVSGKDEARLTLAGVVAGLPALGGSFTLFDIGGGSTEFVLARDGRPARTASLRLGVVPLCERFTGAGPVAPDSFARMQREVERCLTEDLPPEIAAAAAPVLVGTAGTVTTLAALDLGLRAYDADRVQAHVLRRAAVERWLARLGALTLEQRGRVPCIESGRADVLVPGIVICLAIMERLGHESLVVSDRGLREGIVDGLLSAL
jgi:exopolyphosphatase/guanosine-5'-triphosphate,3'-diphosphate pyrophosphatase